MTNFFSFYCTAYSYAHDLGDEILEMKLSGPSQPRLPCEECDNAPGILLIVKGHSLESTKHKKIGKMRAHDFLLRLLIGCAIYSHLGHIFRIFCSSSLWYENGAYTYFVNAPRISNYHATYRVTIYRALWIIGRAPADDGREMTAGPCKRRPGRANL